jgi:hypothetical protein
MVKVKRQRIADCVVGGYRYLSHRHGVGSLLLGLYDRDGRLDHVGFTSTIRDADRLSLTRRLEALQRASPCSVLPTRKAPKSPASVIAVLVLLSIILTASVIFPDATNEQVILGILAGGGVAALIIALVVMALSRNGDGAEIDEHAEVKAVSRASWRMPPLDELPPAKLSLAAKIWMGVLRLYLVVAGGLVLVRIVSLAIGSGD